MTYPAGSAGLPHLPLIFPPTTDLTEKCKLGACTRRSCSGQSDQICCFECEQSDGAVHSPSCDAVEECVQNLALLQKKLQASKAEKLTQFVSTSKSVADDSDLVDPARLGAAFTALQPAAWSEERLGKFFQMAGNGFCFSELCSWVLIPGPEKNLNIDIGSAPLIGVRISASPADTGRFAQRIKAEVPKGFVLNVSKEAKVGELTETLSLCWGLPSKTVILTTTDGVELQNMDESLQPNGVTLPGPAARRRGDKLELHFGIKPSETPSAYDLLLKYFDEEIQKLDEVERKRVFEKRQAHVFSMKSKQQLEEEERLLSKDPDLELADFVCKKIGVTKEKFDELNGNPQKLEQWLKEGNVNPDMNYLVEVTDPAAIQIIAGRLKRKVIRLYRNENQDLKYRYERAKERLRNCGRTVSRESTETQRIITGVPPLDSLGLYDPSLNEYPMWHGTSRESVSGICRTNFDIHRVGKHGLAYGTGFYFADNPTTSLGYSATGRADHVNKKYPSCSYMLLNRVMCGNMKNLGTLPRNHEEFDMWTADCIGAGGVWAGADAKYESIKSGQNFCWVAVHSHQVYPAYLIIYAN